MKSRWLRYVPTARTALLSCAFVLALTAGCLAQHDRSAIDDYYALKDLLKERYGLNVGFKESVIFQQRLGTSLSDNNYNFNGQFDFDVSWDLFGGDGNFYFLYMNIHQVGGITTTAFGEKNGNITPINDSDPNALMRFLVYRHHLLDNRLTVMAGKFESLLLFAANRYAADDRTTFMALPLTAPAAKDRTFSSIGGAVIVQTLDWLSLGASINSLNASAGIPSDPFEDKGYYTIGNAKVSTTVGSLGKGELSVSFIHTEGQVIEEETVPASNGFILSGDQDFGSTFSAFVRIDNTDIQTAASEIVENYSGGIAVRNPFNRGRDIVSAGLFRTKSEKQGEDWETGFEVFYRFGMTEHIDFTANLQGFWPARANGFFTVGGLRLMIRL